jgi:hypothetical protein
MSEVTVNTPRMAEKVRWDFPEWGTAERIDDLGTGPVKVKHLDTGLAHKLGESDLFRLFCRHARHQRF